MKRLLLLGILCGLALGEAVADDRTLAPEEIEVVKAPTPAFARMLEVRKEAHRLAAAQDMDGLEALAGKLRQDKEMLDGGTWILSRFYDCVSDLPKEEPAVRERLDFLEKWTRERPASITARVALARAYTGYAWAARGSGSAGTVTEDGWKVFAERLEKAWQVLEEARALEAKCPGWYEAAQVVALGQGWDRKRYMEMVSRAIEEEPTYGRYYTNACYWLLPRWYGKKRGTFELWLTNQAARYPDDQRDLMYAKFVFMADIMPVSGEIVFAPDRLDWDRTQRGFDEWLREKPDNLMLKLEYLNLALLANDRGKVRAIFDDIGPKYFPVMWKNQAQFLAAWNFAYHDGANPLIKREKKSPRQLEPAVLSRVQWGIHLLTGAIGGFCAGLLLMILALQRRAVWPGVIALAASIALAMPFGTMASLLPGVGLWFYLRRRPQPEWPPRVYPGWVILLGLLGIAGGFLALQFGSLILKTVSIYFENSSPGGAELMRKLFSSGAVFRMVLSASWITFLALLAICGPASAEGWKDRLGLHVRPLRETWPWLVGGLVCALIPAWAVQAVMDDRTRESLQTIYLGRETPVLFLLAVGIVAPILEELIYRGYAYSGWVEKIGVGWTTVATAVIFAATHLQYGWSGLVYILVLGVILAVVRWKTGGVYAPIAIHMLLNLWTCIAAICGQV